MSPARFFSMSDSRTTPAVNRVARILVEAVPDRPFDYAIPDALVPVVKPGVRVFVPFGHRSVTGVVFELADHSDHVKLKSIEAVPDPVPALDATLLKLAAWMADYYQAPLAHAVRTMLPGAVRRAGARFKTQRIVRLADETATPAGITPVQQSLVTVLQGSGAMPVPELLKRAGVTNAPLNILAKRGVVIIETETVTRTALACRTVLRTGPLELMPEQAGALATTVEAMEHPPGVILLYGVTGSGKTEVYLQAIEHALQKGRSAIVLVPEISLTPQTVERFQARFGERIAVLHSNLGDGERHDEWHRIRDGKADIVIGARSAVFAPVRHLGLIVVDEEHEPSYKQEESPRYHARDVAVMRAQMTPCPVLLCTATPSFESWANVERKKYLLSILHRRADDRKLPAVRIVDMRMEAESTGQIGVFSRELLEAIRRRLDRAEQVMLFLNRRGFAASLQCPACGHVVTCEACSIALTYHRSDERLRCHICGASHPVPASCPKCRDPGIRMGGVGTQRVERIAAKCFPQARIQRLDADLTSRKQVYEEVLGAFRSGKIDILVGTQMIAKGLHFPNVTLVGVLHADLGLHIPDFRAGERTFQLLAQVAGRAGRGDVNGEVIIQTYTPAHPALVSARTLDYDGFAGPELLQRKELGYPPYGHMVCLGLKGASERRVAVSAGELSGALSARLSAPAVVSPACPAPLAKAKGLFRYQVLMRGPSVRRLTDAIRSVLKVVSLPRDVALAIDVDAIHML